MSNRTDTKRSLPDRQHLGATIRDARNRLGMTQRHFADIAGIRQCSVSYIENASRDILASTLIDAAATVGLTVALAAEHHLPLLDLTADEIGALFAAALTGGQEHDDALAAALAKLVGVPPVDTTPSRPHVDEPNLHRPVQTVHAPALSA